MDDNNNRNLILATVLSFLDMPRSINDINFVVLPERSNRRRGDSDTSLLLLTHPVSSRAIAIALDHADLVS